jgi:hypothetical protein
MPEEFDILPDVRHIVTDAVDDQIPYYFLSSHDGSQGFVAMPIDYKRFYPVGQCPFSTCDGPNVVPTTKGRLG